jgi:benzoyl-CoA reductase/2-hydroxyglutaryl-CoA dehydratase subunit BcrC/BadD/HgdB
LIGLIEQAHAVVVGENVCFGVQNGTDRVDESIDPVNALAAKYLSGLVCPRMMGSYQKRSDMLLDRIKSAKADGVILQNIRFCDFHGSENGLFERELEKCGIPALRIEREHGALVDSGRLKMRMDAFVEQLASRIK